jgi:hypothetical protein
MRLDAFTVCVGYAPLLRESIALWMSGVESLTVISTPDDVATAELVAEAGASLFQTDSFYTNGAMFNKGLAIAEAYEAVDPEDWVLFFDADIIPETHWRRELQHEMVPGLLYGAWRHDENGQKLRDDVAAGFFQCFHSQDPLAKVRPIVDTHWSHAGNYDSTFMLRWRNADRLAPPLALYLTHQGETGKNWMGLGNEAKVAEMQRERMRRGGGWASLEGEKLQTST